MASEININYNVNYHVTVDLELAKQHFPSLWVDAEGDDDLFEEFLQDFIVANIRVYEELKNMNAQAPYITNLSVREEWA